MKTYSLLAAFFIILISCNNNKEGEALQELRHQRDSLKSVYDDLGEQIGVLEEKIADLDTTLQIKKMLVSTQKLALQTFEHYFEVHGVVETEKTITINAEVPGTVHKLLVKEGLNVRKGQKLMLLDTEVFQRNIQELQSSYELAKTIFHRQEKLWEQKIGSEIQYLEAKNKKESLGQKLNALQAQLKKSVITAPFDGAIDEIFLKEGEMAAPQSPLLRLLNLDKVYIISDVSEEYITKVHAGNYVKVNLASLDDNWLDAKISRVGQYINPNDRTFKVQIDLVGQNNALMPNLLTVLKIRDYVKDSTIVVPSRVIRQDSKGKNYVFIVKDGSTAKKIEVKTGLSYEGNTQIIDGLLGDEEIILDGARSIQDMERIKIKNRLE